MQKAEPDPRHDKGAGAQGPGPAKAGQCVASAGQPRDRKGRSYSSPMMLTPVS